MLRNDIIKNWEDDIIDHLHRINSIQADYPAYTIRGMNYFGVAIPLENDHEVNEDFSNAKLQTRRFTSVEDGISRLYLTLVTGSATDEKAFSALCEQFVYPGDHGEFRKEITSSPLKWWIEMKQILGNKDVDNMVYDTLGELWAYDYLVRRGENVVWTGPQGSSTDIESDEMVVEVKSTLSRERKEIHVHGKSQLTPPPQKSLYLFFCGFEISAGTGYSINDIVYGLANDGYDVTDINRSLAKKGLELGKSARDRKYILWFVYKYVVDENFPRITSSSFVGGKEPDGITSISYTVDLENIPCEIIWEESKKA